MSEHDLYPYVSEATLDELSAQGERLYESDLKALLEPAQNNRFLALHVDSGDYAVGRTSGDALRAMRKRHPADGRLFVRKIGPEPDYGLAARILASDMIAAQQK